jgi:hypothetical protein
MSVVRYNFNRFGTEFSVRNLPNNHRNGCPSWKPVVPDPIDIWRQGAALAHRFWSTFGEVQALGAVLSALLAGFATIFYRNRSS